MRGGFRQVKVREAGVPPGLSAEVLNKIVALVGTSRTADAEFTARIAGPSSIEIPPVQLLSSPLLASYRGRGSCTFRDPDRAGLAMPLRHARRFQKQASHEVAF